MKTVHQTATLEVATTRSRDVSSATHAQRHNYFGVSSCCHCTMQLTAAAQEAVESLSMWPRTCGLEPLRRQPIRLGDHSAVVQSTPLLIPPTAVWNGHRHLTSCGEIGRTAGSLLLQTSSMDSGPICKSQWSILQVRLAMIQTIQTTTAAKAVSKAQQTHPASQQSAVRITAGQTTRQWTTVATQRTALLLGARQQRH